MAGEKTGLLFARVLLHENRDVAKFRGVVLVIAAPSTRVVTRSNTLPNKGGFRSMFSIDTMSCRAYHT